MSKVPMAGYAVHAEYNNGEIVDGIVTRVRQFGDRILLTVKCEQGYRSIYVDKCDVLNVFEPVNAN